MVKTVTVVGGGIAGIYAALAIKERRPKTQVVVVEAEPALGGLLRSVNLGGYWFDYGTHVPRETGHKAIDSVLFDEMNPAIWRSFTAIKTGNISVGKTLYDESQMPYLVDLPAPVLAQGLYELLDANPEPSNSYGHLAQKIEAHYGATLRHAFFDPAFKKLLGVSTEHLSEQALRLFGYQRLIMGNQKMMATLKQIPALDAKLAFTRFDACVAGEKNFYPVNGYGAGLWVEQCVAKAQKLGIKIFTKTSPCLLESQHQHVNKLTLTNGEKIVTDHICWCAPPIFFTKALAVPLVIPSCKPVFRQSVLLHFVFDKPFKTEACYIYINSPCYQSFRVTLYSNLAGVPTSEYKCTVELLMPSQGVAPAHEVIVSELREAGIIAAEAVPIFAEVMVVQGGFPVLTPEFLTVAQQQAAVIETQYPNVKLLGRATGAAFFMQEVLLDAEQKVSGLIKQLPQ